VGIWGNGNLKQQSENGVINIVLSLLNEKNRSTLVFNNRVPAASVYPIMVSSAFGVGWCDCLQKQNLKPSILHRTQKYGVKRPDIRSSSYFWIFTICGINKVYKQSIILFVVAFCKHNPATAGWKRSHIQRAGLCWENYPGTSCSQCSFHVISTCIFTRN